MVKPRSLNLVISMFKGCDSSCELKKSQISKVATNKISTLHYTICIRKLLEIYNNNKT